MPSISDSIGTKFERDVLNQFPDLVDYTDTTNDNIIPDFHHPNHDFWIETKVGNKEWGAQIKDYQIAGFRNLQEPVIYLIGFHNLE